jgi:dual specificity phosphatase 12
MSKNEGNFERHYTNIHSFSIFTLRRKDQLAEAGITHVLSVLRLPLEEKLFEGYKHMVVEVDDVEDENLLEHFPAATRFIEDGLASGGAVLVHW